MSKFFTYKYVSGQRTSLVMESDHSFVKAERIIPILLIFFVTYLFQSCVNDIASDEDGETTIVEGNVPITFTAKIVTMTTDASESTDADATTRVADNAFEDGDQIGLFAVIHGGTLAGTRYIDNMLLTASSDGTLTPQTTIYFPDGDYTLDLIAYYPYNEDGIAAGASSLTVTVQTDQSDDDGLSLSDFLTASVEDVAESDGDVTLSFSHRLSKVQVELIPTDGDVTTLLASDPIVSAIDFYTTIDYDFDAGSFGEPTTQSSNLTLGGDWASGGDRLTGKEMIVVPQEVTEGEQMLMLEWNGKIYYCSLTSHSLISGTQRTISISVTESTDNELQSFVSNIQDWTTTSSQSSTSSISGDYIPVSSLSFASSGVYRVFAEGYVVAEICREYLNNEDISSRATVVYPVVNDEADLTQGTVLELLDVDGNVCGGSVSWADDYTLTYYAGTSSTITRLYIDSDGDICTSQPTSCASVTVSALMLRDNRVSTTQKYAIVKIGSHYWMQEDLAATAYADGTALTLQDVIGEGAGYFVTSDASTYYYNGEAVLAGNLAPEDWRIPTSDDWTALETYAGGVAALKTGTWAISGTIDNETVTDVTNMTYLSIAPVGRWTTAQMGKGKYVGYWVLDNDAIPSTVPYFLGESDEIYWYSPITTTTSDETTTSYYKAYTIRCIKE